MAVRREVLRVLTPPTESKPAPFASMMGFNTWSGGDRYRYAPRQASPVRVPPPEKDFDHFQKGFVFGAKTRGSSERPSVPNGKAKATDFQSLGLSLGASAEEVRAAYRRLARRYHPDKNQGSAEAAERFREVQRAYEQILAS